MVKKKSNEVFRGGKLLGRSVKEDHPFVQEKIEKSLKLSIKEGSSSAVSFGFGLSYFSAFALAMEATASQIGILHAVVGLLPSIIQLKGSQLIGKFSRKRIVLWGVLSQVLIMIPMILSGILFLMGVPYVVWAFIVCVGIYYSASGIDHPAWFSWMGSLVPEENRGKYFSKRNKVAGLFSILTLISGALILDNARKIGGNYGEALGFTIMAFGLLFLLSSIARFYAWTLFVRQYEPKLTVRKKDGFSFWEFLKMAPDNPFGRFAIFRGFISISIGLAAPFWTVYMLRDLGFSYIWFIAITVSATLFQLAFFPLLGKYSDRFGNVKLMKTCSGLLFFLPLLWVASAFIGNPLIVKLYLIFIPQMLAGFVFAGYNLATSNYVYDAVSKEKWGIGNAYMNLMVGVGTFIGAAIGSLIVWIGVPFMNTILFVFLVSAIARFFVVSFGTKYLKEVREVKRCPSGYIMTQIDPTEGLTREFHRLGHIVEKVDHYI